jgi:hypothetical protein
MAKNKVSEWSATPADNTDVGGIDINEGCAPSGINNAIRDVMAQIKDMQTGADGDNFVVGGNLTVNGTTSLTGALTGNVTGNLTGNVTGNVSGTSANVTGIVAVANGGTGATSLAANNVILGNGASAVQLVAPSTAGNVLTSNGTTWTSATPTGGIGDGQTWQNMTSSRAIGTTYTNSTGKPIVVNINTTQADFNTTAIVANISGVSFAIGRDANSGGGHYACGNVIVPVGATYSITLTAGGLDTWHELR